MSQQLWQQMKLASVGDMVGNTDALAELKAAPNGFICIYGPMGCGKTSLALALCHERTGIKIEENQTIYHMGREGYASHVHGLDFDVSEDAKLRWFFRIPDPVFIIIDEAQVLTDVRQQSRMKTLPARPELTLVFCTTNPEKLDPALFDRCVKIRLGPLPAREIPALVKRACEAKSIPFDAEIVRALNRSGIYRPRAIISAVDAVAAGKSIVESVAGQHV